MYLTKLKIAAVALLVGGLLGGAVLATHRALAGEGPAGAPPGAPAPARAKPFFAPAANATAGPAGGDREALQGAWECESAELDGKAMPGDEVRKMRVVVKGDRMVIVPGGEFERLAFKVDAAKTPKVLHVTPTEGKDKGKTTPVIYDLDPTAGTLKLCFDTKEGKKRPTEFAAKPGSGMILLTLRHEPRSPAVQEKPAAAEGLDGSYAVVESITKDERRLTAADLKKCRFAIKAGVISVTTGDGKREDLTFALDPSKEPGRIDLKPAPPEGAELADPSLTIPGIYRVRKTDKGLELTIAMNSPMGKRPENFDGKGPGEWVLRLIREDK